MAQYVTYQDINLSVGDTVRVHQTIDEGKKSRTQIFEGLIIAIKNRENGKSITVRRVGTGDVGVEKILPLHMPSLKKIELKRQGEVRRAKLYFLRDRIGKAATKIKEKNAFAKAAPQA